MAIVFKALQKLNLNSYRVKPKTNTGHHTTDQRVQKIAKITIKKNQAGGKKTL